LLIVAVDLLNPELDVGDLGRYNVDGRIRPVREIDGDIDKALIGLVVATLVLAEGSFALFPRLTLLMAVWRRGKPDALMHYSDRGSQHASERFQRLMADNGIDPAKSGITRRWRASSRP
jgi:hypothetical protein